MAGSKSLVGKAICTPAERAEHLIWNQDIDISEGKQIPFIPGQIQKSNLFLSTTSSPVFG
jgi:hypothetical protein